MKKNINDFRQYIKGKNVAVLGIGISNTPLIKYLSKLDARITAFDRAEPEKISDRLAELKGLDVKLSLGENYLNGLKGFDIIFKTPVIRPDIPELLAEKERGAVITSEMEVFLELCPAETFGITGSDGKTTTTTLIYNMLKEQGYRCWVGGNIGTPLLDRIEEILPTDKVVVELSSFQLMTMKISPDIAVLTNISPNHLDVHKSMEEYIDAKKNIFKFQGAGGKAIFNFDNEITRNLGKENRSRTYYFSRLADIPVGACLEGDNIVIKDGGQVRHIMKIGDILLPGVHNVENYLGAILAVADYVSPETMKKVAETFRGVEHRIEFVREVSQVSFYNDSIGSSPSRTIASVNAFSKKVILITGGYDKGIPYDTMGSLIIEKVKGLVLMGKTGPKIHAALEDEIRKTGKGKDIPVFFAGNMEEAVSKAYEMALPGDTVILSPASASFDMYRNFEERGNHFKAIVNTLRKK